MRLAALDRKLVRDLLRLRGQVLAIAVVIASGVAVLLMSLVALESLRETARAYYERSGFADVFAHARRAPESLARRIAEIPGVQAVETRVVQRALLDVAGFPEPILGQLVSLPARGEPTLNRLTLRAGRLPAPGAPDEVVVSERFAEAHGLVPGARLAAIMDENRRELVVVGVGLSPEFVYAIGPGALMPDDQRYGILWLGRDALAAAYDLDGAFDDVSLSLLRGVAPESVIARLDLLLAPYGGVGAYPRKEQISHWFLNSELEQLATMATVLPAIFLLVAAFLTNMVLERLIALERSEIGLLKAFGYSNAAVAWHYAKLVIVIAVLGVLLGIGLGLWLGRRITEMYAAFYTFPFFVFRASPGILLLAAAVSVGAALLGTVRAVRRAVALPPAEAMRPPAPTRYARGGASAAVERWFDQPTRMILRHALRHPGRSLSTSFGIALAVGLLVTSMQWPDSIEHQMHVSFYDAQHQDVTVGLVDARSLEAVRELARLPGALHVEPVRSVSVRLRAGPRSRREALTGIPGDAVLQPPYDVAGEVQPVPEHGLVLGSKLAELLGVGVGDRVQVEVLEGRRPVRELPVTALVETYLGTPAWVRLEVLNRLLGERPSLSAAHLAIDPAHEAELFARLRELPAVAGVTLRRAAVEQFQKTLAESMMIFIGFFVAFACALVVGITYNATRVSLSERARELATLRVLGATRLEVSYILLGEMALLVLLGLPAGVLVGFGIAWLMASRFETELYRVPVVIEDATLGLAVSICVAAAVASALLVRRRLDRLDLVAVLKTRE